MFIQKKLHCVSRWNNIRRPSLVEILLFSPISNLCLTIPREWVWIVAHSYIEFFSFKFCWHRFDMHKLIGTVTALCSLHIKETIIFNGGPSSFFLYKSIWFPYFAIASSHAKFNINRIRMSTHVYRVSDGLNFLTKSICSIVFIVIQ